MSTTLIIVLIIVVWLVVLAPLIFRGQKPIRHSGDGFNDTRVVFSGGKDVLQAPLRPRMKNARSHGDVANDQAGDYELVEAEEYEIIDEPWHKRDEADADTVAADPADIDSAADTSSDVIDGEVIDGDVIADNMQDAAEVTGATESAHRDEDRLAADDAEMAATETAEDNAPAQPRVVVTELPPEEMYDHDETYTSPVDLLYPGVTDADAVITRSATEPADNDEEVAENADGAADTAEVAADEPAQTKRESEESVLDDVEQVDDAEQVAETAENTETTTRSGFGVGVYREGELTLTEDELAFAARRSARGGWNPEAERKLQAQRIKHRRRALLTLAVAIVVTLAIAIPAGGWFWAMPAAAGLSALCYVLALRGQVQQERELRARRIRQLRRAHMGVRNREDDDHRPARSQNLRRPGAVVLEIDDESPDFSELRNVDYQQIENQPADYAARTLRRPQQASRTTTLHPVGSDGSLEEGRVIRSRGRRVV